MTFKATAVLFVFFIGLFFRSCEDAEAQFAVIDAA
jgi:hypothetical protein